MNKEMRSGNKRRVACPEEIVFLDLARTTDMLSRGLIRVLKTEDVSPTQYNVLRILRGTLDGLPCGEIAARMITRDPDITRLLDRLEAGGLVARSRQKKDRRVVQACITPAGIQLLKTLDKPVETMHHTQFAHVPAANLRQLLTRLKEIRSAVAQIKACAGHDEK